MTGPSARARNSIGSDSVIANRSALASASVLGTSSAKTIVNSASRIVTTISDRPSAVPRSMPDACRAATESWSVRLTAA